MMVRDDHQIMVSEGVLPEGHKAILDANPDLKNNPQVQAALDVLARKNDPNQTVSAGEQRSAVTTLRSIIDNEFARQQTVDRSQDRLDAKAEKMVERLLEEDSISEWVYGEDDIEKTRRLSTKEDTSEDFYSFVAQEIEKNPNIDPQVAVKNAIDLLEEENELDLRLEEGRQLNKEEAAQEAADREAAINALMDREDLSRKDAIRRLNELEAEALMSQVGRQSISRTSYQ